MPLTVLQQQTKALAEQWSEIGAAASKQVGRIKHLLWHGNVDEALERLTNLLMDLELIRHHAAPAEKLATGIEEFETYIRTIRHPSRTTASATGRGTPSARRSSNRQSTTW